MKKLALLSLLLLLCLPLLAQKKEKDKDWKTGKIVEVKVQDMQAENYKNPNSIDKTGQGAVDAGSTGVSGGSFTSAPAHFVTYNLLFETDDEFFYLRLSREVSFKQPDLKIGSIVKYKRQGPKSMEVYDSLDRKYEYQIIKHDKKSATQN